MYVSNIYVYLYISFLNETLLSHICLALAVAFPLLAPFASVIDSLCCRLCSIMSGASNDESKIYFLSPDLTLLVGSDMVNFEEFRQNIGADMPVGDAVNIWKSELSTPGALMVKGELWHKEIVKLADIFFPPASTSVETSQRDSASLTHADLQPVIEVSDSLPVDDVVPESQHADSQPPVPGSDGLHVPGPLVESQMPSMLLGPPMLPTHSETQQPPHVNPDAPAAKRQRSRRMVD